MTNWNQQAREYEGDSTQRRMARFLLEMRDYCKYRTEDPVLMDVGFQLSSAAGMCWHLADLLDADKDAEIERKRSWPYDKDQDAKAS